MKRKQIITITTHFLLAAFQLLFLSANAQTASSPIVYSGKSNIIIDGKKFTSGTSGVSINLTNCSKVKITNCEFILTKDIIGVQLQNCSDIEVTGCYFENFRSGVYAITCTGGINIHCNSYKNIAGIKPRGQIVQFNKCSGAGNRVNYNILDHEFGTGTPEDLINMYGSYGTSADPIQIIGNQLRGGGPSTSGGGIMIGDDGGHDMRVEDNILVDVGQYGIGVPAGYNITVINNKVYGASQTWTNVGIYVGLQGEVDGGFTCTGSTIQVKDNQVKFTNKNNVVNGWYNCSCCSGVVQSGNNFKASITASILPTTLSLDETNCGEVTTALSEVSFDKGFVLYPNPANHQIVISNISSAQHVVISNAIGQTVFHSELIQDEQIQLDISSLSGGIYFIQMGNEVQKFIKE